jgi:hypothetical protein
MVKRNVTKAINWIDCVLLFFLQLLQMSIIVISFYPQSSVYLICRYDLYNLFLQMNVIQYFQYLSNKRITDKECKLWFYDFKRYVNNWSAIVVVFFWGFFIYLSLLIFLLLLEDASILYLLFLVDLCFGVFFCFCLFLFCFFLFFFCFCFFV